MKISKFVDLHVLKLVGNHIPKEFMNHPVKKKVLLKLTGEVFLSPITKKLDNTSIKSIAEQIKQLSSQYYFGVVIGGGNFFRGNLHGKALELSSSVGHQIGMLATVMNGLIIKDLFEQAGISTTIFCALPSSEIGTPISQQAIRQALDQNVCIIFTGGTGNPFFTTDTTAIVRGLQIQAHAVWKATHVDGIYDADPRTNVNATFIKQISFQDALQKNLKIMDATAFTLAKENNLPIRVFNIFQPNALLKASESLDFGSIII